MEKLSDQLLVDTYYAAMEFKLEAQFIRMIANELKRRGLILNEHKHTA